MPSTGQEYERIKFGGQEVRSWSHKAEDKSGGLAEPTLSTPLGRVGVLVTLLGPVGVLVTLLGQVVDPVGSSRCSSFNFVRSPKC